jgi:hypothetical protein
MTEEIKETFECRACRIAKRVERVASYAVGLLLVGLVITALFIANYLLVFEFDPNVALILIGFDIATVWVVAAVAGGYFEKRCEETKRKIQEAVDEARKKDTAARDLVYQQRVNSLKRRYEYWK